MRDIPIVAPGAVLSPAQRDPRLDVFRGLALVMIFINHVPGTIFENYTNRNFGFSDAAEGFVIMSGISAGLAYSGHFRRPALWPAVARVWARAWTLYLVHITITLWGIGIAAGAAHHFGLVEMIGRNNLAPLFRDPLGVLVGLPTLGHQIGYFNILPLYFTLLLATPLFILLALRRPWLLLAGSALMWIIAAQFRINLPAYPNPGGWFFNPFSWQMIFVLGLLTGLAMKRGERFVPVNRALVWACGLFLLLALLWVKLPPVTQAGRAFLTQLGQWGAPFYVVRFDKTFLSLPRLLHVVALFYFISALPWVRGLCHSRLVWPLDVLGRQALPVFALGSVLSILMQAIKTGSAPSIALDVALIVTGLAAQLLLAMLRDLSQRQTRMR